MHEAHSVPLDFVTVRGKIRFGRLDCAIKPPALRSVRFDLPDSFVGRELDADDLLGSPALGPVRRIAHCDQVFVSDDFEGVRERPGCGEPIRERKRSGL